MFQSEEDGSEKPRLRQPPKHGQELFPWLSKSPLVFLVIIIIIGGISMGSSAERHGIRIIKVGIKGRLGTPGAATPWHGVGWGCGFRTTRPQHRAATSGPRVAALEPHPRLAAMGLQPRARGCGSRATTRARGGGSRAGLSPNLGCFLWFPQP